MFVWLENMDPLSEKKDPTVALILGFLCGGIGLGIYFKSLIDFVFPVLFILVLSFSLPVAGTFFGAVCVGVYGYFRAVSSNNKLGA